MLLRTMVVESEHSIPGMWDMQANVVIVGAGGAGLPAAVEAAERGESVILVDQNVDVGGHAIVSGGGIFLGGGTSLQKKYGIPDTPDILYRDCTNPKSPESRYNDRELIRVWADNNAPTFEWLVAHGVKFRDERPIFRSGHSGMSFPRLAGADSPSPPSKESPGGKGGAGIMRPLERAARSNDVQILLRCKLLKIIREMRPSGRVLGIVAKNLDKNSEISIRAGKSVIIATGGHSSNVNFRRIFDPRLTEEYQVAGEPYSYQDASGEIAAMEVGASIYGTANQTVQFSHNIMKPGHIGCKYGYVNLKWLPGSPYFSQAGASGLTVKDWQDVILVNQRGLRFYDETRGSFTEDSSHYSWVDAALGSGADDSSTNGGGPIWAIFDSDAVKRENWNVSPPDVDPDGYWFFSASTIQELAASTAKNQYQKKPMPDKVLEETVERYNSFVESGIDLDFGKPEPKYRILTPPFYAAWATPIIHDSCTGLRINTKCQVIDIHGQVIPSLYCAGESAGGAGMHGLARCIVQGRIAAMNAASEPAP